ncbi:hypothetical protein [Synechococcus sp. HK05]|uniref:hypothetical protein n=1 Tax=Synechococcus sp. HK05 TaxID=2725975 RepID=UPI0020CAEA1B|nr:hypothetical protein [Synechococcus sp. HK05]
MQFALFGGFLEIVPAAQDPLLLQPRFTWPCVALTIPFSWATPRQGRRSRVDPFEAHADLIPQWLEAEADVGSKQLL